MKTAKRRGKVEGQPENVRRLVLGIPLSKVEMEVVRSAAGELRPSDWARRVVLATAGKTVPREA